MLKLTVNELMYSLTSLLRIINLASLVWLTAEYSNETDRVGILVFATPLLIFAVFELGTSGKLLKQLAKNQSDESVKKMLSYYKWLYFFSMPVALIYGLIIVEISAILSLLMALYLSVMFINKPLDVALKATGNIKCHIFAEIVSNTVILIGVASWALLTQDLVVSAYACIVLGAGLIQTFLKFNVAKTILPRIGPGALTKRGLQDFLDYYRYEKGLSMNSAFLQLLPSIALPIVANFLPANERSTFIIVYRAFAALDQLTWSPFYANLPKLFSSMDTNLAISNGRLYISKVIFLFLLGSIVVTSILLLPKVGDLFKINPVPSIMITAAGWMIVHRLNAMRVQLKLVAGERINFLAPIVIFGTACLCFSVTHSQPIIFYNALTVLLLGWLTIGK